MQALSHPFEEKESEIVRAEVSCPFCETIAGANEDRVVYRDDQVVAFLDHRPLFKGHALVVPVRHVATLGELTAEEICTLFEVVAAVSRADESALRADGSFVANNNRISQSVPHLHVHVVPRHKHDGLRGFFWPRTHYDDDAERDAYARLLREGITAELAPDAEGGRR